MQPPSLNMCGNLGLIARPAAFANRGCEFFPDCLGAHHWPYPHGALRDCLPGEVGHTEACWK
jgi:hypothetical protein